jgi:hypothetical protein
LGTEDGDWGWGVQEILAYEFEVVGGAGGGEGAGYFAGEDLMERVERRRDRRVRGRGFIYFIDGWGLSLCCRPIFIDGQDRVEKTIYSWRNVIILLLRTRPCCCFLFALFIYPPSFLNFDLGFFVLPHFPPPGLRHPSHVFLSAHLPCMAQARGLEAIDQQG